MKLLRWRRQGRGRCPGWRRSRLTEGREEVTHSAPEVGRRGCAALRHRHRGRSLHVRADGVGGVASGLRLAVVVVQQGRVALLELGVVDRRPSLCRICRTPEAKCLARQILALERVLRRCVQVRQNSVDHLRVRRRIADHLVHQVDLGLGEAHDVVLLQHARQLLRDELLHQLLRHLLVGDAAEMIFGQGVVDRCAGLPPEAGSVGDLLQPPDLLGDGRELLRRLACGVGVVQGLARARGGLVRGFDVARLSADHGPCGTARRDRRVKLAAGPVPALARRVGGRACRDLPTYWGCRRRRRCGVGLLHRLETGVGRRRKLGNDERLGRIDAAAQDPAARFGFGLGFLAVP